MKKFNSLPKSIRLTITAAPLWLLGSATWAGELGYGFAPGLMAGKDFLEGQVIVGYRTGTDSKAVATAAQALGGTVAKEIQDSAILLNFGSEQQAQAAIREIAKRADVQFIERNGVIRVPPQSQSSNFRSPKQRLKNANDVTVNSVSADPTTGFEYHLTIIRKTAVLPALSATPPTVAVLDTGVDWTHPDLAGKVLLGKNTIANNNLPFDDNGRGTHIAGIIAAKAGNAVLGEGVCPNCKILAIKVLNSGGAGTVFDVAEGLKYARTWIPPAGTPPVKVVNVSFWGIASPLIANEVLALKNAGKVLVAAAGDDNASTALNIYPAADPNTALRVTATEEHDCRAYFSNFSPSTVPTRYNIAAPGWQIPSTLPDMGYAYRSGTPMASAMVAGGAALVWGQIPGLTRDQLVNRLIFNGKMVNCGFAAPTRRLDVRRAITGVSETTMIGRLLDPATGKAPVPSTAPSTAQLFAGGALLKSDLTDRGGFYEMTGLAAGTLRELRGFRAGYVNATLRKNFPISAGLISGPLTDALPGARPAGHATITLDWKTSQPIKHTTGCIASCNGWDLDLSIRLPSGTYIDPSNNPGTLLAAPYIRSVRDSFSDLQPLEGIVISNLAANGVYRVFVDNWPPSETAGDPSFNNSWTGSQASVQMYNGAALFGIFYPAPIANCGLNRYWHVGNLTKNGTAYIWANVNTCSNIIP